MSIIIPILIVLVGLMGGMLVNYLSDSLPHSRRLSRPHCWNCEQSQTLINYFLWPRRCPHCGKSRKKRIWLVEILAVVIAVWLWNSPPERLGFYIGFIILVYFGSVVVMDIEYRVILHPVSIVGAVLAGGVGIWIHGFSSTLFGGFAGFGIMFGLYYLGESLAKWLSRRRGQELDDVALGFGDVNLAGVIGLLMGWPGIVGGLVVGILAGGIFSFIYIIYMMISRKYSPFTTMPYGPFLIIGAVALMYFK